MKYVKEEILEIYNSEITKSEAARLYAAKKNIEFTDTVRRKVADIINKGAVDLDLENETVTESNQYSNDKEKKLIEGFSAIDNDGSLMSIERYCEYYGLNPSKIRSYKLISHTGVPYFNIVFYSTDGEVVVDLSEKLDDIVSKYITPFTSFASPCVDNFADDWFDRLVYTDTHINMNVNGKDNTPLYRGKWDKEEVLKRLDIMTGHVIKYQKSKVLIINDLGDFMDGMGGYTTRGGHQLPQNTTDIEAFELGIEFKLRLIDTLMSVYDKIICRDTVNDNHSGLFSAIVSSAVSKILKERYGAKIEYYILDKFIEHFQYGNHTFVESHGKDKSENRFNGFKVALDAAQIEKIDQYCKEHKLYNGSYIEFSKGNDHQAIYDDTTSNDFQYYSYLAFSPPSNYIKTNFKHTKSGFRFYNIHKEDNTKITIPYFFK